MLFLVESIHGGSMGGHPRTRMCDTGEKLDVNQDRSGESRAYFIDILNPASLCLCGRCEERRRLDMQGSGPDSTRRAWVIQLDGGNTGPSAPSRGLRRSLRMMDGVESCRYGVLKNFRKLRAGKWDGWRKIIREDGGAELVAWRPKTWGLASQTEQPGTKRSRW